MAEDRDRGVPEGESESLVSLPQGVDHAMPFRHVAKGDDGAVFHPADAKLQPDVGEVRSANFAARSAGSGKGAAAIVLKRNAVRTRNDLGKGSSAERVR